MASYKKLTIDHQLFLRNKFLLFLIIFLALTAFLAGYLLIEGGVGVKPRLKTGTVLDKFGEAQESTINGQRSTVGEKIEPFLVADRKVMSFTNSLVSGEILYAEKSSGKIFRAALESKAEELASNLTSVNLSSILWSPNKKEVVVSFSSASGFKFKYYNLETGKSSDLDQNIRSLAFSPDGNYIAYYSVSPPEELPVAESEEEDQLNSRKEPNKILISQPDGSYPKKILNTRLNDLVLRWPIKEKIAFKTPGGEIFLLTERGQLDKLTESSRAEEELWSKNGKKLLISQFDQTALTPKLLVKDIESRGEVVLDIAAKASQCAWSIDNVHIFCVTPKIELYKINTSDNSRKLLATLDYPIKDPTLSPAENYLLFINSADEKLYSIKINRGSAE